MKILFHHRTRSKDGQAVHIDELTSALRALGHKVVVVGPAAMDREALGAEGGTLALLRRSLPKAVHEIMELAYAVVAYRRLKRAYLRFRPDGLYERYNLFQPAGLWLKKKYRLPMLLEVNAPLVHERSRFGGLALRRLARWSEGAVWCGADYVLPVTKVLAGVVRDAGARAERIVVIPNGINRRRFAEAPDPATAKRRLGLQGRLVLGFTGFVRTWHGLDAVIELIADSDPSLGLHLLLVGDGPARSELERLARRRGIEDRLTITGVVERDRIKSHIAAFDIALQPQVTPYASPLKIFEYMALGRAIVAPATANIREILRDGHDALLFSPETPGAFAIAIERLSADPGLRERLGRAARRTIDEKRLTWDENAKRIDELLQRLMAQQQASPTEGTARPPRRTGT